MMEKTVCFTKKQNEEMTEIACELAGLLESKRINGAMKLGILLKLTEGYKEHFQVEDVEVNKS